MTRVLHFMAQTPLARAQSRYTAWPIFPSVQRLEWAPTSSVSDRYALSHGTSSGPVMTAASSSESVPSRGDDVPVAARQGGLAQFAGDHHVGDFPRPVLGQEIVLLVHPIIDEVFSVDSLGDDASSPDLGTGVYPHHRIEPWPQLASRRTDALDKNRRRPVGDGDRARSVTLHPGGRTIANRKTALTHRREEVIDEQIF